METIKDMTFGGERPLFAAHDVCLDNITITDGESGIKCCKNIECHNSKFYGKYPILGIGLGFLALSDYLDFELVDLPQEFNGINYPVIEQNTNTIWQTSMNIDQLVLPDSIKMNMNREYFDLHSELMAGFWNTKDKLIATAFNPEGAPGTHDADEIFDYFVQMME